jgi:hypothetical protein
MKSAALQCLKVNGLTVDDMVIELLRSGKGAKKVLEADSKKYVFHVVGISVNFELWASIDGGAPIEIGFVSDH